MQFLFGADFIGVEVPTGVFPNKRKKKKKSCFFLFFSYFNVSIWVTKDSSVDTSCALLPQDYPNSAVSADKPPLFLFCCLKKKRAHLWFVLQELKELPKAPALTQTHFSSRASFSPPFLSFLFPLSYREPHCILKLHPCSAEAYGDAVPCPSLGASPLQSSPFYFP